MKSRFLACAYSVVVAACVGDNQEFYGAGPGGGCAVNGDGCLLDWSLQASIDRTTLQSFVDPAIHVDNGYDLFSISYVTDGRTATATVTLPKDLEGDTPIAGFPLVINSHGTIGLDDPCRLSGTEAGAALAGLFGARGAIGVAPDYPGLGSQGLHPYLVARSEATSVLDAGRAALRLATNEEINSRPDVALVGMSQGGHAAIAAAALAANYAPELHIRVVGVAAPASVFREHWAPGIAIAGPHLIYHAMLARSFADAAGAPTDDIWAPGTGGAIESALNERCAWSPQFTSEETLNDVISSEPNEVFSEAYLQHFAGDGGIGWLDDQFAKNRLTAPPARIPIRIYQGSADEVVLPFMTEALVSELQDNGADVDLVAVEGATHLDTAYGFLGVVERSTDDSVAWIQDHLALP